MRWPIPADANSGYVNKGLGILATLYLEVTINNNVRQRLKWKNPQNQWNNAAAIFAVIEELPAVDTKANLDDGNIIIRVSPK